jgi:hypothetical protein
LRITCIIQLLYEFALSAERGAIAGYCKRASPARAHGGRAQISRAVPGLDALSS